MSHIIYCYRSVLPDLFHHVSSHPLPSLLCLRVLCYDDKEVRALTTFLPYCTNLRTLHYKRGWRVSESAEKEMWDAAVRRCRNLEEVRVWGDKKVSKAAVRAGAGDNDVSCDRLVSVMRKLSERQRIQALKLRRIVCVDRRGKVLEDYTEHVKHLLPALQ